MNKLRLKLLLIAGLTGAGASLTGCGDGTIGSLEKEKLGDDTLKEAFPISILTSEFSGAPTQPDSPLWKLVEEYTNTRLTIYWTPNASYSDKLNITLASRHLPMLVKVENTTEPAVVAAIDSGAFWELGPYLKDYPNLSQANPDVLQKLETDGKLYGLYRARPMGRVGVSYRKDWLDRLGLEEPRTIEQFYKVLYAFTYEDPDGNGLDDTYGLAVSRYPLPWDMMQVWFGAPNKWGFDSKGGLVPDHMTEEYKEALRFFRTLYEEKLVNPDFPIYDPTRWNDQVVNGQAGVMLDVADTAGRLETAMAKADPRAVIDVGGMMEGPYGVRALSTSGFNGVYMVSRTGVKTEEELRRVLSFLDQLNDIEMQKLLSYGLEGVHYKLQDGRISVMEAEKVPTEYRWNDMNQLLLLIPDRVTDLFKPATPLREKVNQVMSDNLPYLIHNPAEGLESQTYIQRGAMLDHMIEEARIQYIVGKLDDGGLDEIIRQWRTNGGDQVIREINEAYKRNR